MSFINPTVKRTIAAFPFNIQFIAFSLYYFFSSKLLSICVLQFFFVKHSSKFFAFQVSTQSARNIPGIFAECSLSVVIFETSRKHLINEKLLDGKVLFKLKVYDLIITYVDLLANSSNHEVMFPEYLRNITQMTVSKIFQGYPRNIVKL